MPRPKRSDGRSVPRASGTQGADAPRILQSYTGGLLTGGPLDGGTLTIASGSVTITSTLHNIAAESGLVDSLAEMKGGYQGRTVTIRCDGDDLVIAVKHNDTSEGTAGNRFFLRAAEEIGLPGLK